MIHNTIIRYKMAMNQFLASLTDLHLDYKDLLTKELYISVFITHIRFSFKRQNVIIQYTYLRS